MIVQLHCFGKVVLCFLHPIYISYILGDAPEVVYRLHGVCVLCVMCLCVLCAMHVLCVLCSVLYIYIYVCVCM